MLLQSQESQHKRAFAAVVRASEVFARLSAQRHELRRLCDAAPIFENDDLIGPSALILEPRSIVPRHTISSMLELILVGGPTAVLEYGGLRWLTDPTLSPPGEYPGGLIKTTGPAMSVEQIGPIDAVLLSHDHHADNLDPAGREWLPTARQVFTTVEGAQRLGAGAIGLAPWSSAEVDRVGGKPVTVTAVPAQHGPDGSDSVMGQVIGFLLTGVGLSSVYVSGDNASLNVVRAIAERHGPVDVALLFAGAVQLSHRFGGAYLTLSSDQAAEAAKIVGAPTVIPMHYEGWTHFTQGADALRAAFAGNGIGGRLTLVAPGATVAL